jgi:hypothetical protein
MTIHYYIVGVAAKPFASLQRKNASGAREPHSEGIKREEKGGPTWLAPLLTL